MLSGREILLYLSIVCKGNPIEIYERIIKKENIPEEEKVLAIVNAYRGNYITILDDNYPERLKNACRPPFVLFYEGDISLLNQDKKRIAVVGSRNATEYGLRYTNDIVSGLVDDYVIVSGLAKGIDSCAHYACVNNKGKTIAVMGCGLDKCYPIENKNLKKKIAEQGLVISEYPNGVESASSNFPLRNRIIAGLSNALLVTDAGPQSGTLITIRYANELNLDCFVLPHPVGDGTICNRLIYEGALLVETAEDIKESIKNY